MANKSNAQMPILQLIKLQFVYSNEQQSFIKNLMGVVAFFIQFLQVWNAERPNFNLNAFPVVKPPNVSVYNFLWGFVMIAFFVVARTSKNIFGKMSHLFAILENTNCVTSFRVGSTKKNIICK